jgi:hypothetical protein
VKVEVILNVMLTLAAYVYVSDLDANDEAPANDGGPLCSVGNNTGESSGQVRVLTNTSKQVGIRASAASKTTRLATLGWVDLRGKN